MAKGIPNKRYTGEFKQQVVEAMMKEKLSYCEAARQFDVGDDKRVAAWERIYLEEGPEGLYIERRGRRRVQRLRAENAYLKKLNALVAERVRQERKQK